VPYNLPGYCPMGCGETLTLLMGTYLCKNERCPDRLALNRILDDPETEHIVVLGEESFSIKHPLRERLDDELLECDLTKFIVSSSGPPEAPGRYRVIDSDDQWTWFRLTEES
jgi:hypothetical protein